jgi:zinc protease
MVRKKPKRALAAGGVVRPAEHPGLFMLFAVGLPNHSLEQMKQGLLAEVSKIAEEGVSARELTKAKNQLATGHLQSLQSLWGLANRIGMSTYREGDPRAFLDLVKQIDAVTAEDVKRVARTYLVAKNFSLVLLQAGKVGRK